MPTEAERIAGVEARLSSHEMWAKDLREADQRAIEVAADSVKDRLEKVNEFRQQLSDQASTFLPRNEYDVNQQRLIERIDANQGILSKRLDAGDKDRQSLREILSNQAAVQARNVRNLTLSITGIGALGTIIYIVTTLLQHH